MRAIPSGSFRHLTDQSSNSLKCVRSAYDPYSANDREKLWRWLPSPPLQFLTLSATVDRVARSRFTSQKSGKELFLTLVRKYLRVLERYLGFPRYCSTPKVVPRRDVGVSKTASRCLDIPFLSRPSRARGEPAATQISRVLLLHHTGPERIAEYPRLTFYKVPT